MKRPTYILLTTVSLAALTACSPLLERDSIQQAADTEASRGRVATKAYTDAIVDPNARRARARVGKPWIAGTPQPLSREVTLPMALRASVDTKMYMPGGQMDLLDLADRISGATGVRVTVAPDALMPPELFLPKLPNSAGTVDATKMMLPTTASLPMGTMPLPSILDAITRRLGVSWKYDDARNEIRIFRLDTRTFYAKALTTAPPLNEQTSDSQTGRGSRTQGADSDRAKQRQVLDSVEQKLLAHMSRSGNIVVSDVGTSSVVITDTVEVLDRIAPFIEQENRLLSRQVALTIERISVRLDKSAEMNVDWEAIYEALGSKFTFSGPVSEASAVAGALGVNVGRGPFNGTSTILGMLSQNGNTVENYQIPLGGILNRQVADFDLTQTFDYINRVSTSALGTTTGNGTGNALPQITAEQKEETTGLFISLRPDAQPDGQILLSFQLSNRTADPLKAVTFGSGDNRVQIQQRFIRGMRITRQTALRPGIPAVLAAYESVERQSNDRRMDDLAPLAAGGSTRVNDVRVLHVFLISGRTQDDL